MKTQHQEDYLLLFRGNAWLKQLSLTQRFKKSRPNG